MRHLRQNNWEQLSQVLPNDLEINPMSRVTLIRLGGLAAMLAGIFRGISAIVASDPPSTAISVLYLLTDIFLLFGMMGLYSFQLQESKLWGFFGFLLAIVGIMMIRTDEIAAVNLYAVGAVIFAAGLTIFAVGSWMAKKLPKWISACWIISTIVGFVGYFIAGLHLLFIIAGILFGIGFAGAGAKVWSTKSL
jgi:hypothetical protein